MSLNAKAHTEEHAKRDPVYTIGTIQDSDDVDLCLLKDGEQCVRLGHFSGHSGILHLNYLGNGVSLVEDARAAGIGLVEDKDGDLSLKIESYAYVEAGKKADAPEEPVDAPEAGPFTLPNNGRTPTLTSYQKTLAHDAAEALVNGFTWSDSAEGAFFWLAVHERLEELAES